MKSKSPTPHGGESKLFSFAPHTFDEAVAKILKATPEPKPERQG
jgi:hypothetical protein